MDRRTFLATIAGCTSAGLAGCGDATGDVGSTSTPTPVDAPSLAEQGFPPDICATDVLDTDIVAIEEPAFAPDWSGVDVADKYADDGRLPDDEVVVGIERDDTSRAYPVSVLWYHEIVNDRAPADEDPVLVTFCSLCRSGMVAERLVDGEPSVFGVSGQLWQPPEIRSRASEEQGRVFAVERGDPNPGTVRNSGNLVMFDESTGSFWSQLLARAICGPREGERLPIAPSTTQRWAEWHREHPDTDVLLPPPHSTLQDSPG